MAGAETVRQALERAEDAMVTQALLHRAPDSVLAGAPVNRLQHHPADRLAGEPGLRTRDDGALGSNTASLIIDLEAPPAPTASITWELSKGGNVVSRAEAPASSPISLIASGGGRFLLTARDKSSGDVAGAAQVSLPQFAFVSAELSSIEPSLTALSVPAANQQAVWDAILSAAKAVTQHILRPANFRVVWPDDDVPAPFTPHAPGRATRLSPKKPYIHTDENSADETHIYTSGLIVRLGAPNELVSQASDVLTSLGEAFKGLLLTADMLASFLAERLGSLLPDISSGATELPTHLDNEPDWYFDGLLSVMGVGSLRLGLGAMDFSGNDLSGAVGSEVDQALRALAAGVDDWADPASTGYARFTEAAGRQIGICLARAVARLYGVPVDTTASGGHLTDVDDNTIIAAANLFAAAPAEPPTDLLGLWRPSANAGGRAFTDLAADLDDQQTRAAGPGTPPVSRDPRLPEPDKWADLAELEAAAFRDARDLAGPASKYDVLAGIVSQDSLDYLDARLGPLPPAYGPYEFQAGDRDGAINAGDQDAPVYGADPRPDDRPADDLIAVLQRDLHAVGIGLGLQDSGFYAYRRWTDNNDKYDGAAGTNPVAAPGNNQNRRDALKAGDTGWAVREFQIAARYPNRVAERLDSEAHYANRLHVVVQSQSPTMAAQTASGAPSHWINGALSIADGERLRRWRFMRLRYPVVVVAGSSGNTFGVASGQAPVENLDTTDGVTSTAYRVRAVDRSGFFGAPQQAAVLGDYGTSRWGGPHNSPNHPLSDITPDNTLGVPIADWQPGPAGPNETPEQRAERERRERFLSAFRVAASIGEVEAVGHFDGLNAWDGGVFSYPLFHHTLTLPDPRGNRANEARPGQMAAFIHWLQHPDQALLESVFPDASTTSPPDLPAPYPGTQAEVEALRRDLTEHMQAVYMGTFGFFGIGAGTLTGGNQLVGFTTATGLETATTPGGNAIDMHNGWDNMNAAEQNRHQAFYQAYQQWFRSWQWFYRFAAALRQHQNLRTLLFAYEMNWIRDKLSPALNDIQTESGRAVYIRVAVRGSSLFSAADARTAAQARGNTNEADAIRNAIRREMNNGHPRLQGLLNSTRGTMNYNSGGAVAGVGTLEATGTQSNTIYQQVRNDVLRRLIV